MATKFDSPTLVDEISTISLTMVERLSDMEMLREKKGEASKGSTLSTAWKAFRCEWGNRRDFKSGRSGASDGTRTHKPARVQDFKSCAFAGFATLAFTILTILARQFKLRDYTGQYLFMHIIAPGRGHVDPRRELQIIERGNVDEAHRNEMAVNIPTVRKPPAARLHFHQSFAFLDGQVEIEHGLYGLLLL
jgi:hypothetical protein